MVEEAISNIMIKNLSTIIWILVISEFSVVNVIIIINFKTNEVEAETYEL